MHRRIGIVFFIALLVGCSLNMAGAAEYSIVDIGAGSFSDINYWGTAVGYVTDPSGGSTPVVWSNGVTSYLQTLPEYRYHRYKAAAINDSGQIVGTRVESAVGAIDFVIWTNGQVTQTTTLIPQGPSFWGTVVGMTASGQFVGWELVDSISGYCSSFLWDNGVATDIAPPGAHNTVATGVNDRGQIVGWSQDYFTRDYIRFLWQNGAMTILDTGSTGNLEINNLGQVAGTGYVNGTLTGFIWQDGNMIPIGMISPIAINDFSQIVGGMSLWWNGSIYDLRALVDVPDDWILERALDINNHGQILLQGTIDGISHGFLLSPYSNSQFAVPEPPMFLLLLVGLIITWGIAKRFGVKQMSTAPGAKR